MSHRNQRHIPLPEGDTSILIDLRDEVLALASRFIQVEWSKVSGRTMTEAEPVAADPEALLIFTESIAIREPELEAGLPPSDESARRLINLSRLQYLADGPTMEPDLPSIDIELPVNFAFKLRTVLGVTARAELVRIFMGSKERPIDLRKLTEGAGVSTRQTRRLLRDFQSAGFISEATEYEVQHFRFDTTRWLTLLGLQTEAVPMFVPWPVYLRACLTLIDWICVEPGKAGSGPQLEFSADQLLLDLRRPFAIATAGVSLRRADFGLQRSGEQSYWTDFADYVRVCLSLLDELPGPPVDQASSEGDRSAKEGPLRGGNRSIGSGASE